MSNSADNSSATNWVIFNDETQSKLNILFIKPQKGESFIDNHELAENVEKKNVELENVESKKFRKKITEKNEMKLESVKICISENT